MRSFLDAYIDVLDVDTILVMADAITALWYELKHTDYANTATQGTIYGLIKVTYSTEKLYVRELRYALDLVRGVMVVEAHSLQNSSMQEHL